LQGPERLQGSGRLRDGHARLSRTEPVQGAGRLQYVVSGRDLPGEAAKAGPS
jgi:hypothetical protein